MNLIFTSEARADLIHIGDKIAEHNPARAITFVEELEAKCLALLDNPLQYSVVPRHEASGMRRIVHGNYLIFYRVEAAVVTIIRCLHGAMDYDSILFSRE